MSGVSEFVEMTPEQEARLDAMLADPTKIETHMDAVEVLDVLDQEIAGIEAQLEAARIEAAMSPLSEARQHWVRRAAYAGAMKRNQRHRVMQRDREIRGGLRPAHVKKDPAEGLAKQARLQAEADVRREGLQLKKLELANTKTKTSRFVQVAQERLTTQQFAEFMEEAKRRVAFP